MRGVTCVFVVVALGVMANLRVCLCQFGFWAYMRFRCCCAWRDSNLRVCLLCQFSLWAFMQPCSFVARCIVSVVVALQAIILMTRTFTCWMRVCCRTFESSCKFKSESLIHVSFSFVIGRKPKTWDTSARRTPSWSSTASWWKAPHVGFGLVTLKTCFSLKSGPGDPQVTGMSRRSSGAFSWREMMVMCPGLRA